MPMLSEDPTSGVLTGHVVYGKVEAALPDFSMEVTSSPSHSSLCPQPLPISWAGLESRAVHF